jgi:hypothetical protein
MRSATSLKQDHLAPLHLAYKVIQDACAFNFFYSQPACSTTALHAWRGLNSVYPTRRS